MLDFKFWEGKKIFLTGHTGFKGSWTSILLNYLKSDVKGFSLDPPSEINLFSEAKIENLLDDYRGDIRDYELIFNQMKLYSPDIVIHMAAQPLVRRSFIDPLETITTNAIGTANVLFAAQNTPSVKLVLNITTDKCYENKEIKRGYHEDDTLGGFDPYSASKGCSELISKSFEKTFFREKNIQLSSVRAGNVIGGGDWAEDRLLPDLLHAIENKKKPIIRNPKSVRPWQHVLEPICGYLKLVEKMNNFPGEFCEAWNFGPELNDIKEVSWITRETLNLWGENCSWEEEVLRENKESKILMLDISKAKNRLKWFPKWKIKDSLEKVVQWHRAWLTGYDAFELCKKDIESYMGKN